jgi:hypothetical protein
MDRFDVAAALARLDLTPPRPMLPALVVARDAVTAALIDLLRVPDRALSARWVFRAGNADVRFGFYHLIEIAEETAAGIDADAWRAQRQPNDAMRILAQTSQARSDLQARLLGLPETLLDADPGEGEWTIRATLDHVTAIAVRYALQTAFAVQAQASGGPTSPPPESLPAVSPAAADRRTVAAVRSELDETVDLGIGLLLDRGASKDLRAPTVWAGHNVTVRFRLHRWSAHLCEHAIQVDKTLAALGDRPTEVRRLVRAALSAHGQVEAAIVRAAYLWSLPHGDGPETRFSRLDHHVERFTDVARRLIATA